MAARRARGRERSRIKLGAGTAVPCPYNGRKNPPATVGGRYIRQRLTFPWLSSSEGLAYTFAEAMKLEDYKTILYRQADGSWVAEIPAIAGCYALMETREAALAELNEVFAMIAEEYREKGLKLPADSTEIVNA